VQPQAHCDMLVEIVVDEDPLNDPHGLTCKPVLIKTANSMKNQEKRGAARECWRFLNTKTATTNIHLTRGMVIGTVMPDKAKKEHVTQTMRRTRSHVLVL
jgi:hypothetical protein